MESLADGDFDGVVRDALYEALGGPTGCKAKRQARKLFSSGSGQRLMYHVLDNPDQMRSTVALSFAVDDDVDTFLRGLISRDTPEADRRVSDQMISYIDLLQAKGRISFEISDYLFFAQHHVMLRWPGSAGRWWDRFSPWGVYCDRVSLGVATAVYLEEMAPKNRFTEIIEININNLAAVPSVVFGIMGLAIFIVIFGMPRSIPLSGGNSVGFDDVAHDHNLFACSIGQFHRVFVMPLWALAPQNANHNAPCFTSCDAGYVDRHHHWDGPSFG